MATYLVTGTAGFIASRVATFLLEAGHTVVGLDNLNDAYDVRFKEWRLNRLRDLPRFQFHHLDICDRQALNRVIEQIPHFDAIINLAARAGVRQSVENPWNYIDTNVTGTLNLLESCRERAIQKFVLASTSSLYGANNQHPFQESANTNGTLSPYAASKKAAEVMCYTYHYLYNLDVTVLRYFTVYGPAGRPDMSLFRFVQWISEDRPVTIFGDGQQSRDFTYVDDIARGTILALQPLGYEVINLGSDQPIILADAICLIEELIGKQAKLIYKPAHPADVKATWADITKAQRLLGWRPQIPFEQGVRQLVQWYQNNRHWAQDIATS